jgi:hypothetical protein
MMGDRAEVKLTVNVLDPSKQHGTTTSVIDLLIVIPNQKSNSIQSCNSER